MLNIGRMGRGSQGYYLHNVTRGVEDYYLGRGEAPGEWLGRGTHGLGLGGQVTAEQLGRVLAAEHPATGEGLSAHPARKVPGFDLTFRAPKSVSLLWAFGDEQVVAEVERAHDAAVASAVGYLEEYAVRTRRGAGGAEVVQVDGLVGAAFRHRTSRAGDPLLHTHVLAANLVRAADDGRWRTLDSRRLFAHARTAGVLYQAHLRAELTRGLGVSWQPVTNGYADLDGVRREWIETFSKRRQAIVAELAARGEHSAAAAQVATLDTRQAKTHQPDPTTLRAGWQAEADRHGIPAGWWTRLLDRARPVRPDVEGLQRQLVDEEAVTATTSTFATPDLVRTIAERCPNGATVTDVVRSAGLILGAGLSSGEVVQLAHHNSGLTDITPSVSDPWADGTRFTTRGLLLLEQAAINTSVARRNEGAAVADDAALRVALGRRPTLGEDQLAMITRLTRDGDGVAVVVGKAGTGKTFALDAARDAWEQAGMRVTGTALAARAAIELQDSSGIASTTIAGLLSQVDEDRGLSPLHPGQVLVVDEAGMVGTRTLARLLNHAARRQVKVVLVGDPHQLPEIEAGGLFLGLTRRLPTIELTSNRRQTEDWEQRSLDELRTGSVGHAVDAYRHHGRLVAADTVEEIREQLVSDWWAAFDERTPGSAIMVALRHADVRDLNHRARARLQAAGLLTGPPHQAGDTEFQVGDRVMFLRNRRGYGLINGQAATLTRIRNDGWLEAERDDGRTAWIPPAYLDAGHLTHGYAITGHKAQGLTVDHTFVLGSDTLYREWGYVAMSRGRQSNRLYVHSQSEMEPDAHIEPPTADPTSLTATRLLRSRTEDPLTTHPVAEAAPFQWVRGRSR